MRSKKYNVSIDEDQALFYQLVESTLKLNLDYQTAIECINLVLTKYKPKTGKIRNDYITDQMYFKYKSRIKKYSKEHVKLVNQRKNRGSFLRMKIESLLFNVVSNDLIYNNPQVKILDTDDLIFKALLIVKTDEILNL